MKNLTLKHFLFAIVAIVYVNSLYAQPQKMSYQAVVRDASGYLLTGATVGMRISIIPDTVVATPVYIETQTPTTNANGLATIAIGTGTVVSGSFPTINWSTGVYFIKTEIDPAGGTSYSIISTQQLMSVPYALYAQTCGTGGPTGGTHYVGESYGGGIIFYIYQSGGVQHGLIASLSNLSDSTGWSNITTAIGTAAESRWDGLNNSLAIVAQPGHTMSAAKLCLDYSYTDGTGTYNDWYLPSLDELSLLMINAYAVDKSLPLSAGLGVSTIQYWCSTEGGYHDLSTYCMDTEMYTHAKSSYAAVRAIRSF